MNDSSGLCASWARQFASTEIAVLVNKDGFDRDYGKHVQIQVAPTALDKPKIEIMIVGQSVGFMVECWDRLSARLIACAPSAVGGARAPDHVAAYLEPGTACLQRTASLLDALARGSLEIQARVYRGRLVGSGARITSDSEVVDLVGPTRGADVLKHLGLVETFKLDYFGWASRISSLADQLGGQLPSEHPSARDNE